MSNNKKTFIIGDCPPSDGGGPIDGICPIKANIIEACDSDNTITLTSGSTQFNKTIETEDIIINGKIKNYNGSDINGKILSGSTEGFELVDFPEIVSEDNYTTGATLNGNILSFDRTDLQDAYNINLSGLTTEDNYTTGVTLNGNILSFDRTDLQDAYNIDLSTLNGQTPSLQDVIDEDQVADKVIFRKNMSWSASTNSSIVSSIVLSDGNLLLYGSFSQYNDTPINNVVKINEFGEIDETFNIGTGINNTIFFPTKVLETDDGIYLIGDFTLVNGVPKNRIVRLNFDGSIDETFNIGTGFSSYVADIIEDNYGKLIVSGRLTNYNGTPVSPITGGSIPTGIIRLNTDGSVDPTFSGITGGTNNIGLTSTIDNLDRIYYTSYGTIINGITSSGIIRFNSDGSIDTTFNIGTGLNVSTGIVNQVIIDNLNRIYIFGFSTTYNGNLMNGLIRINDDGSVDNTFDGGTKFNNNVRSVTIQSDNKLIVGGTFTEYNGIQKNGLVRLNTDGSIDESFNVGDGFTGPSLVESILITNSNKIFVFGNINNYNGTSINNAIKLNQNGSISGNIELTFQDGVAEYNINDLNITTPNELLPKQLIEELIESYIYSSPLDTISIDSSTPTNIKFDISDLILSDIDSKEELSNKVNTLSGTSDNYPSITALNNIRLGSFGITIDGAGNPPSNGLKGYLTIPYNCTIIGWDVIGDTTGDCILDVWKNDSLPSPMDSITGSEKPSLNTEQIHRNYNLISWDTMINEDDIIAFNLESSNNLEKIILIIKVRKH